MSILFRCHLIIIFIVLLLFNSSLFVTLLFNSSPFYSSTVSLKTILLLCDTPTLHFRYCYFHCISFTRDLHIMDPFTRWIYNFVFSANVRFDIISILWMCTSPNCERFFGIVRLLKLVRLFVIQRLLRIMRFPIFVRLFRDSETSTNCQTFCYSQASENFETFRNLRLFAILRLSAIPRLLRIVRLLVTQSVFRFMRIFAILSLLRIVRLLVYSEHSWIYGIFAILRLLRIVRRFSTSGLLKQIVCLFCITRNILITSPATELPCR